MELSPYKQPRFGLRAPPVLRASAAPADRLIQASMGLFWKADLYAVQIATPDRKKPVQCTSLIVRAQHTDWMLQQIRLL